jgi:hypothetical protein
VGCVYRVSKIYIQKTISQENFEQSLTFIHFSVTDLGAGLLNAYGCRIKLFIFLLF